jgi:DNA processing protein
LGCGVDIAYPRENKATYEKILECGAIISEYRPGIQPLPQFFPARNRIISGMSRGVLVVEAAEKSGTNITVDYAQSQGREVLAIPGNITSEKSKSPNKLIREGAAPVTSYMDVLEWFEWQQITEPAREAGPSIAQLTMEEMAVIRELEMGETQFDELLLATDFTQPQLTAMLVSMEIKGIVERLPGNKYTLKGR